MTRNTEHPSITVRRSAVSYVSPIAALLAMESMHYSSRSDAQGVLEKPLRPGRSYKHRQRARQAADMKRRKRK